MDAGAGRPEALPLVGARADDGIIKHLPPKKVIEGNTSGTVEKIIFDGEFATSINVANEDFVL